MRGRDIALFFFCSIWQCLLLVPYYSTWWLLIICCRRSLRTWCLEEGQEFSAHARDTWTWVCRFWKWKLDTWELLSIIWCDLDCEIQRPEAGLASLAFNCSVIRQLWSWKRRVLVLICGVQINFLWFCAICVFFTFFYFDEVLMSLWSPFSSIK